jgi:hypothetical protein
LQKLIEHVAIGSTDFDTVKASLFRVLGPFPKGLSDALNLGGLQCAGGHTIGKRAHQAYMASGADRAGSDRYFAVQEAWV